MARCRGRSEVTAEVLSLMTLAERVVGGAADALRRSTQQALETYRAIVSQLHQVRRELDLARRENERLGRENQRLAAQVERLRDRTAQLRGRLQETDQRRAVAAADLPLPEGITEGTTVALVTRLGSPSVDEVIARLYELRVRIDPQRHRRPMLELLRRACTEVEGSDPPRFRVLSVVRTGVAARR